MVQFIHDNVGYIEQTATGFHIGLSWGFAIAIPTILLVQWMVRWTKAQYSRFRTA